MEPAGSTALLRRGCSDSRGAWSTDARTKSENDFVSARDSSLPRPKPLNGSSQIFRVKRRRENLEVCLRVGARLPDDALSVVVVQSSEKHPVCYAFSNTPGERKTVDLCVGKFHQPDINSFECKK